MTDGSRTEGSQQPYHTAKLTRRKVVIAGGAAVAAAGVGGTLAAGGASADERGGEQDACYVLTAETTEGPYYIDADKIRRDVTEDKDGIPLVLRVKVIDSDSCRPLKHAAVDIWHCDALGLYSGYEDASQGGPGGPGGGEPPTGTPTDVPTGPPGGGGGPGKTDPTDDNRYLRGTWLTDRDGHVEFRTVFPGWYRGRAVHIHTKVHVGGKLTDTGYEGGHTCHTGQFFFDEASVLASAEVAPYSTSTTERTTLTEDTIYDQTGVSGGLLRLRYKKNHIAGGVIASITVGVDPDETHEGQDGVTPAPSPSASAP
ncbi:intradiol ring-cleavage dioxygenase [Streptomyces kunmingensis]|uniref:Intradiol ring-cleavage dioxygenase n=1 Tax=Streptomyces kunmingensis TaxID=68225 RepID=A0ABU6CH20_9ACTN|nr:intradiol ring-cleavage dioxygenase [Streptomyces kunmingensis]MEB3963486.1 intradiol ring-cleavage dioxygenase [Streptomyces kunmingensis]